MQRGDEIEVTADNLSGDGKAVGRIEGMVCFLEHAVPGDLVRAVVWKVKKNYAEARTIEIVKPSPLRTYPDCKHFGVCGGCRWQNLSYEAQLRFKQQRVIDAFMHIGGFGNPDVASVIGCQSPYYYRNKMEFTFSNRRWLSESELHEAAEHPGDLYLGLHVPQRWDKVVDIQECRLQSDISNRILNSIRDMARELKWEAYSTDSHSGYLRHLVIRQSKRTGDLMVNVVTNNSNQPAMQRLTELLLSRFPEITTVVNNITTRRSMVALGEEEVVYHGDGIIRERLGNFVFTISANSFFQTNTEQAEKLYATAREFAELSDTDVVYDLYSGTGSIAIFLSDAVDRVIGIEMSPSAIADAEKNAAMNHVSNCTFLQGDLKDRLTRDSDWLTHHPMPTVIVADPPRSGMHEKVVEKIVELSPGRVVYVSCNPSTQARDAKLLASGGYRLVKIQPVDMFPHTDHIEAVALFVR